MAEVEAPGPVDFILIEFPEGVAAAEVADALEVLVEDGVVRLYDVALVHKGGASARLDLTDPGWPGLAAFAEFAGAQSGLFDDEDIASAAGVLDEGTAGLLLAYENAWAIPFVDAAHRAGGQLVASQRIPAQVLLAALDAGDQIETTA